MSSSGHLTDLAHLRNIQAQNNRLVYIRVSPLCHPTTLVVVAAVSVASETSLISLASCGEPLKYFIIINIALPVVVLSDIPQSQTGPPRPHLTDLTLAIGDKCVVCSKVSNRTAPNAMHI